MSEPNTLSGKMTRRTFLKASGGAAAGAGLATGGMFLGAGPAHSAQLPASWDEEADVVIIGSGFAGLAAAMEVRNKGSAPLVLEKMKVPGGNSIINGGLIAAANSELQNKEGIKDSPELMFKDMLKAGLGLNHPDLVRKVCELSNETVQWTIETLGVQYKERVTHLGGHSVPRSCYTTNNSGSGIVLPMIKKVKALEIPLRTGCYLTRIFKDEEGAVRGVEIREGYAFPEAGSGTVKTVKARQAVVMATGGFGYDIPFRTIQDPRLTDQLDCTNQPGATAEGLIEALRLGATPVQLSWIQLGPWACPDEKGMGIGYIFAISSAFPYGVMVDPATGKRFVNELADRKVRSDAILKTGHPAIGIADQTGARYTDKLGQMLSAGTVKEFNTLGELAEAFKIDYEGLKETIEKYNAYVKTGKDEEQGKPIRQDCRPVETPPFYGMRLWPKIHHTMGGVQIDEDARVIDLDHRPIGRLYAAGEITGGVHGAVRLGSNATADCLVFGRIAGQKAAEEPVR